MAIDYGTAQRIWGVHDITSGDSHSHPPPHPPPLLDVVVKKRLRQLMEMHCPGDARGRTVVAAGVFVAIGFILAEEFPKSNTWQVLRDMGMIVIDVEHSYYVVKYMVPGTDVVRHEFSVSAETVRDLLDRMRGEL